MTHEHLAAAHWRLVKIETLICTCLNGLLPASAMFFLYRRLPISLMGPNGLAVLATKNTIVAVLLMTTIMTWVTRRKMRSHQLPAVAVKRHSLRWQRLVPSALTWRAPLFAVLAWTFVVPAVLCILALLQFQPLDRSSLLMFNIIEGAAVGCLMTPLIQISALLDDPHA